MSERRLIDVDELSKIIGLTPKTIYKKAAPKAKEPLGIKAKRVGRCLRFDSVEVQKYLDSL